MNLSAVCAWSEKRSSDRHLSDNDPGRGLFLMDLSIFKSQVVLFIAANAPLNKFRLRRSPNINLASSFNLYLLKLKNGLPRVGGRYY